MPAQGIIFTIPCEWFFCINMHTSTTYLLETILTKENKALRQQVINHPFWKKIEDGTLDKKYLALFALQDNWLVKQAPRIDSLLIASIQDVMLRKLLLERLAKQVLFSKPSLFQFAESIGVTKKQFEKVEPIAGCMALTTFFYWMIDNTGDLEKIVSIDASKEIFSLLCVKVKPALMKYYNLTEKDVTFFTVHEHVEEKLGPVDTYIINNCKTTEAKKRINFAVRLSLAHELLFYTTILQASLH